MRFSFDFWNKYTKQFELVLQAVDFNTCNCFTSPNCSLFFSFIRQVRLRHRMRQIAATRCQDRLYHVKIICHCDLSHEFKPVWIRETYCSDKISASSLVAACIRICDKSLQQNLNQPMRERQLVSHHVKFELVYISSLPKSIACLIAVTCRSNADKGTCDVTLWCVAAICHIVCLSGGLPLYTCSQTPIPSFPFPVPHSPFPVPVPSSSDMNIK